MFGGKVLAMMDVTTAISATRFCWQIVVTASTEPVDFRNPIYVGEIIELKSRVAWVGNSSMIVRCEVHGENSLTGERRLCCYYPPKQLGSLALLFHRHKLGF